MMGTEIERQMLARFMSINSFQDTFRSQLFFVKKNFQRCTTTLTTRAPNRSAMPGTTKAASSAWISRPTTKQRSTGRSFRHRALATSRSRTNVSAHVQHVYAAAPVL